MTGHMRVIATRVTQAGDEQRRRTALAKRHGLSGSFVAMVLAAVAAVVGVSAAPHVFCGANNGLWATTTNWCPTGVPGPASDVQIPSGKRVTSMSGAWAVASLSMGDGSAIVGVSTSQLVVAGVCGPLVPGTGTRMSVGMGSGCAGSRFVCAGGLVVDTNGTWTIGQCGSGGNFGPITQYGGTNANGTVAFVSSSLSVSAPAMQFSSIAVTNFKIGGVKNVTITGTFNVFGTCEWHSGTLNAGNMVVTLSTTRYTGAFSCATTYARSIGSGGTLTLVNPGVPLLFGDTYGLPVASTAPDLFVIWTDDAGSEDGLISFGMLSNLGDMKVTSQLRSSLTGSTITISCARSPPAPQYGAYIITLVGTNFTDNTGANPLVTSPVVPLTTFRFVPTGDPEFRMNFLQLDNAMLVVDAPGRRLNFQSTATFYPRNGPTHTTYVFITPGSALHFEFVTCSTGAIVVYGNSTSAVAPIGPTWSGVSVDPHFALLFGGGYFNFTMIDLAYVPGLATVAPRPASAMLQLAVSIFGGRNLYLTNVMSPYSTYADSISMQGMLHSIVFRSSVIHLYSFPGGPSPVDMTGYVLLSDGSELYDRGDGFATPLGFTVRDRSTVVLEGFATFNETNSQLQVTGGSSFSCGYLNLLQPGTIANISDQSSLWFTGDGNYVPTGSAVAVDGDGVWITGGSTMGIKPWSWRALAGQWYFSCGSPGCRPLTVIDSRVDMGLTAEDMYIGGDLVLQNSPFIISGGVRVTGSMHVLGRDASSTAPVVSGNITVGRGLEVGGELRIDADVLTPSITMRAGVMAAYPPPALMLTSASMQLGVSLAIAVRSQNNVIAPTIVSFGAVALTAANVKMAVYVAEAFPNQGHAVQMTAGPMTGFADTLSLSVAMDSYVSRVSAALALTAPLVSLEVMGTGTLDLSGIAQPLVVSELKFRCADNAIACQPTLNVPQILVVAGPTTAELNGFASLFRQNGPPGNVQFHGPVTVGLNGFTGPSGLALTGNNMRFDFLRSITGLGSNAQMSWITGGGNRYNLSLIGTAQPGDTVSGLAVLNVGNTEMWPPVAAASNTMGIDTIWFNSQGITFYGVPLAVTGTMNVSWVDTGGGGSTAFTFNSKASLEATGPMPGDFGLRAGRGIFVTNTDPNEPIAWSLFLDGDDTLVDYGRGGLHVDANISLEFSFKGRLVGNLYAPHAFFENWRGYEANFDVPEVFQLGSLVVEKNTYVNLAPGAQAIVGLISVTQQITQNLQFLFVNDSSAPLPPVPASLTVGATRVAGGTMLISAEPSTGPIRLGRCSIPSGTVKFESRGGFHSGPFGCDSYIGQTKTIGWTDTNPEVTTPVDIAETCAFTNTQQTGANADGSPRATMSMHITDTFVKCGLGIVTDNDLLALDVVLDGGRFLIPGSLWPPVVAVAIAYNFSSVDPAKWADVDLTPALTNFYTPVPSLPIRFQAAAPATTAKFRWVNSANSVADIGRDVYLGTGVTLAIGQAEGAGTSEGIMQPTVLYASEGSSIRIGDQNTSSSKLGGALSSLATASPLIISAYSASGVSLTHLSMPYSDVVVNAGLGLGAPTDNAQSFAGVVTGVGSLRVTSAVATRFTNITLEGGFDWQSTGHLQLGGVGPVILTQVEASVACEVELQSAQTVMWESYDSSGANQRLNLTVPSLRFSAAGATVRIVNLMNQNNYHYPPESLTVSGDVHAAAGGVTAFDINVDATRLAVSGTTHLDGGDVRVAFNSVGSTATFTDVTGTGSFVAYAAAGAVARVVDNSASGWTHGGTTKFRGPGTVEWLSAHNSPRNNATVVVDQSSVSFVTGNAASPYAFAVPRLELARNAVLSLGSGVDLRITEALNTTAGTAGGECVVATTDTGAHGNAVVKGVIGTEQSDLRLRVSGDAVNLTYALVADSAHAFSVELTQSGSTVWSTQKLITGRAAPNAEFRIASAPAGTRAVDWRVAVTGPEPATRDILLQTPTTVHTDVSGGGVHTLATTRGFAFESAVTLKESTSLNAAGTCLAAFGSAPLVSLDATGPSGTGGVNTAITCGQWTVDSALTRVRVTTRIAADVEDSTSAGGTRLSFGAVSAPGAGTTVELRGAAAVSGANTKLRWQTGAFTAAGTLQVTGSASGLLWTADGVLGGGFTLPLPGQTLELRADTSASASAAARLAGAVVDLSAGGSVHVGVGARLGTGTTVRVSGSSGPAAAVTVNGTTGFSAATIEGGVSFAYAGTGTATGASLAIGDAIVQSPNSGWALSTITVHERVHFDASAGAIDLSASQSTVVRNGARVVVTGTAGAVTLPAPILPASAQLTVDTGASAVLQAPAIVSSTVTLNAGATVTLAGQPAAGASAVTADAVWRAGAAGTKVALTSPAATVSAGARFESFTGGVGGALDMTVVLAGAVVAPGTVVDGGVRVHVTANATFGAPVGVFGSLECDTGAYVRLPTSDVVQVKSLRVRDHSGVIAIVPDGVTVLSHDHALQSAPASAHGKVVTTMLPVNVTAESLTTTFTAGGVESSVFSAVSVFVRGTWTIELAPGTSSVVLLTTQSALSVERIVFTCPSCPAGGADGSTAAVRITSAGAKGLTVRADVSVTAFDFSAFTVAPPRVVAKLCLAVASSQMTPLVVVDTSDGGCAGLTSTPCSAAGQRLVTRDNTAGPAYDQCGECPRGGYCPGGGIVWPIPGFWSQSQWSTPIECAQFDACPGANGEDPDYPALTGDDGHRVTARCRAAYSGGVCAQCSDGYTQFGTRCESCGGDSAASEHRFLLAAALIVFGVLALSVATLSSKHLAWAVTAIIALQQFVVIGKASVSRLPPGSSIDWFAGVINFLSVVNFDVQMVKPGCVVPPLTFVDLFWATVAVVAVALAMLMCGAALRATWVWHLRLKGRPHPGAEARDAAAKEKAMGAGGGDTRVFAPIVDAPASPLPPGSANADAEPSSSRSHSPPTRDTQPLMSGGGGAGPSGGVSGMASPKNRSISAAPGADAVAAAAAAGGGGSSVISVGGRGSRGSSAHSYGSHNKSSKLSKAALSGGTPVLASRSGVQVELSRSAVPSSPPPPAAAVAVAAPGTPEDAAVAGAAAVGGAPRSATPEQKQPPSPVPAAEAGADVAVVVVAAAPAIEIDTTATAGAANSVSVLSPKTAAATASAKPGVPLGTTTTTSTASGLSATSNTERAVAARRVHAMDADTNAPDTDERQWAVSWRMVFRARAVQSALILGHLIFLKVLTLGLQMVYCVVTPGSESQFVTNADTGLLWDDGTSAPRLAVDLSQVCYVNPHLPVVLFDYPVVILAFAFGFPVVVFWLLRTAFRADGVAYRVVTGRDMPAPGVAASSGALEPASPKKGAAASYALETGSVAAAGAAKYTAQRESAAVLAVSDARRADTYGYLYRGLKSHAWFFRLFMFATNWGFAAQSVFSRNVGVQMFVPGVLFLVNAVIVALLKPYRRSIANTWAIAVGVGGVVQVLLYLGLLGSSERADPNSATGIYAFLYWLLALSVASLAFIVFWRRYGRKHYGLYKRRTGGGAKPLVVAVGATGATGKVAKRDAKPRVQQFAP